MYPHPATVSLFRLGRTLKYKKKPGRPLPGLRAAAAGRLVHLLEGLGDADLPLRLPDHADWTALVARSSRRRARATCAASRTRSTPSCAPTSRCSPSGRPELTTTYGDLETGYIVTPTLPSGHRPSPRAPRAGPVRHAVQAYAALQPELQKATAAYVELVTTLLDDAGINYLSVTGRAKRVASFAAKADRSGRTAGPSTPTR